MNIISKSIVKDLPLSSDVVDDVLIDELSSSLMDNIQLEYYSNERQLILSAGENITSVDCNDFIKDGMLSNVELCDTTLIMIFNTDAGQQPISIDLSSFIDDYSNIISSLSSEMLSNDKFLSTSIDNKIFIDGISAESLSAIHIGQDDFYDKIVTSAILSNELYIVSSDYINAYGEQIKNLAEPELSDDAATKNYVDNMGSDAQDAVLALSNQLSSYFDKRETNVISGDVIIYQNNLNIVNGNSVVDGNITVGDSNIINGAYSLVGGQSSIVSGDQSFAFGYQVSALSNYAHAEGKSTLAAGDRSHAEGGETKAYGEKSHAEGGGSIASADMAHAEGEMTSALWRGGHAEGKKTIAYMYAHAEGSETLAGYDLCASNAYKQGDIASHAEGYQTSAIARFSHAEGYGTRAGIADLNLRPDLSIGDVVEKSFNVDQAAHAEGISSIATGIASHAAGIKANAKDDYSFVWSGIRDNSYRSSHGLGTFNIYPKNNDINNVYIGTKSLSSWLSEAGANYATTTQLNNGLAKKLDKCSNGSILGSTAVIAFGTGVNKANGNQSIAIGNNVSADSAGKSIAYGANNEVKSPFSLGFGENVYTSGVGKAVAIGNSTSATAAFSYAFGKLNSATNEGSRAIGLSSCSSGKYSLAFGEGVSATNQYSIAFGYKNLAKGSKSFAIGNETTAVDGAISFGNSTAASALYSIAGGNATSVLNMSEYSIAVGSSNKIQGIGLSSGVKKSFVAGTLNTIIHSKDNTSYPENIFVIGKNNSISALSAAENIFVGGYGNTIDVIKNNNSFIYGNSNYSNKGMTIVEGESLSAKNSYSCMFGRNAYSTNDKQFIWSAGGTNQETYAPRAIGGSFNINPVGGVDGVFIKNDSLRTCIENVMSSAATKDELSSKADKDELSSKVDKILGSAILSNNALLAHGNTSTSALGNESIVIGNNSYAKKDYDFIFGDNISADSNQVFAFGNNNILSGNAINTFVAGSYTTLNSTGNSQCIFAGGLSNTINVASNNASFIYGRSNCLSNAGINFIAGEGLSGNHNWSMMLGRNAKSSHEKQFIWNAGANNKPAYVPNVIAGSFNVNPVNGIKGFYIGTDNFVQCVLSAVQMMSDTQKLALKTALSIN